MTERIISNEWSRLAEDDGTIGLEHFEYDIVIGGDNAGQLSTKPTNINYSPSLNKAKDITIDVPPTTNLENLSYLGEPIKLFVDQELAFFGEIKEIETNQNEGEDYAIYGQPFGKKLTGSDVERTVNNEIVSDTVSKIVDRYNVLADEHENMVNTADESLHNMKKVGGNVRQPVRTPANATYLNVGDNMADLTSIYVKAFVPHDEEITVELIGENTNESRTISNLDKNSYGEWARLSDFPDVNESFDLRFTLESNCLLIDWTAVLREEVRRETTAPEVNVLEEGTDFYSFSGKGLKENALNSGDNQDYDAGLYYDLNDRPKTRQITTWSHTPFPEWTNDDEYENGTAGRIADWDRDVTWDLDNPESEIQEWDLFARVKPFELLINRNEDHTLGNSPYDDEWQGNAALSTDRAAVESTSVEITGDCHKDMQWNYDNREQFGDLVVSGQMYVPSTSPNIAYKLYAGPFVDFHENDDGYGFQILSNEIRFNRYDAGSETVLTTETGYSIQANEWFDWEIRVSRDDFSVEISDSSGTYNLAATDSTHNVFGAFSVETITSHYVDDIFGEVGGSGGIKNANIEFSFGGNTLTYGTTVDIPYRQFGWKRLASHDFVSQFPDSFSSAQEIVIRPTKSNETAFMISPMVAVHKGDQWNESDFDVDLHAANGYLDGPPLYATGEKFGNQIRFQEQVSEENIFKSSVDCNIVNTTNVVGGWGPSQVIDGSTTDFPLPPNSSNHEADYAYPGVQHLTQVTLCANGIRDTDSPRRGYKPQRLDSISVTTSTSDLEILFNHDLSNNRLALMNSIANESSVMFRWEGNKARIFHRGQETTNINLNSESISSSVTIEDVYRYCEVVGLHNVRSGLITSKDAPAYIDDTKIIRDESIENETDAKNRARQFLEEHGTVKFKGNIETKPTFAPLGAKINGSLFNHGQDMIINGVSYSKRGTSISLGYSKDISTELVSLHTSSSKSRGRATGRGMKIPVGEEQI